MKFDVADIFDHSITSLPYVGYSAMMYAMVQEELGVRPFFIRGEFVLLYYVLTAAVTWLAFVYLLERTILEFLVALSNTVPIWHIAVGMALACAIEAPRIVLGIDLSPAIGFVQTLFVLVFVWFLVLFAAMLYLLVESIRMRRHLLRRGFGWLTVRQIIKLRTEGLLPLLLTLEKNELRVVPGYSDDFESLLGILEARADAPEA